LRGKIYREANRESCRIRETRNRTPQKSRKTHLKRKYGIDQRIYELMLKDQNNCCAICKSDLSDKWTHHASGEERTGRPAIVFANSLESVDQLHIAMSENGVNAAIISGNMDVKQKDKIRRDYQAGKYDCLILTEAGESGLNLQRAKALHHLDIPDTDKSYQQRCGRIDRCGQDGDVKIYDWVTDTPHEKKAEARRIGKKEHASYYQNADIGRDESDMSRHIQAHMIMKHETAGGMADE